MEDADRVRLARIEEHIKTIRIDMSEVKLLARKVYKHDVDIALLQRDKKWEARITHGISGVIGAIIMGALEWFHK